MTRNISTKDRFANHLGAQVLELKENFAKVKLAIKKEFLNSIDTAHGGALFSLADYTFALAANTSEEIGIAIEANIQFIKPALEGDVVLAEARMVSRSKRLGTFTVTLTNSKNEILAYFTAMAYFKSPK